MGSRKGISVRVFTLTAERGSLSWQCIYWISANRGVGLTGRGWKRPFPCRSRLWLNGIRGKHPCGACRLCMVEVVRKGRSEMTTACTLRATEGLEIVTDTPEIVKHRKILFELYIAEAPRSGVIKRWQPAMG